MAKKAAKKTSKKAAKSVGRMGAALEKAAGKPLRIVLLDSHAILHRSYHAIPDFTSAKGEPTGALYGLILTLLKIRDALKPDYIIATRDMPGKTVRHDAFAAYKAKRAKIDEELLMQLKQAPQVFDAFGIPTYGKEGYEADDMLGTIVHQLKERREVETIIATGDSDTLQLVSPHVRVFMLRTGISDTVIYDEDAVRDRYGFGPERVIDYKGIVGDTSDNIPGVPGVGETSAKKLIAAYGDLPGIYQAIKKHGVEAVAKETGVQKQYVQRVAEHEEQAEFSKQLATIHHDVPIGFSLPEEPYDMEAHLDSIARFLDEFDFRSIKARLMPDRAQASDSDTAVSSAATNVDPREIDEAAIALWLLRSDLTNPSLEDILRFGNTNDFAVAKKAIFEALAKTGRLQEVFETIERPLLPIVRRMNEAGVLLDTKYFAALAKEYNAELATLAKRIYGYVGHEFNVSSPKQLGDVLYDELGLGGTKQKKTATGARTTKEEELLKLRESHPIIDDVLAYRELQKLLGTYIEKLPKLLGEDGRLHANLVQAGTTTGRMSSQEPNLQNIPIKTENGRRIRKGFVAPKGFTLAAIDYSQIELRIAAGLSGDEKLIAIFQAGGDVHTAVAAQVFGVPEGAVDREMRRRAKVINFGILYGMGVNALKANLGGTTTRDEAQTFLDDYFKNFSQLSRYIDQTIADASRLGYTETLFGRRRYFPGFQSSLPNLRAQAERMAMNAPIQGTQADIIKLAMVAADELIERKGWRNEAKLLLQVHDELVYELAAAEASAMAHEIRRAMETVVDAKLLKGVPIVAEVSIGPTWGDVQKTERV